MLLTPPIHQHGTLQSPGLDSMTQGLGLEIVHPLEALLHQLRRRQRQRRGAELGQRLRT